MSPRVSHSLGALPLRGNDVVAEVVDEFRAECRGLAGVESVRVLFRDAAGAYVDETGSELVSARAPSHPVVQAAATGRAVAGSWSDEGPLGVAVPIRHAPEAGTIVWFAMEDPSSATGEAGFLFENAVRRLGRQLGRAAHAWTAERRRAALAFAEDATACFLRETSLHRALRLCVTDLAELAEAKEVSIWRMQDAADPTCIAQVRGGASDPERVRHTMRLLGELARAPQVVRVVNTAHSEHYAWCHAEGIGRFLARPVSAYDRFYGFLLVLDYTPSLALGGETPPPGLEEATGVLAAAAAAAFYQVDLQDHVTRLRGEVRAIERAAEDGQREAALFELSQQAASALEEALADVRRWALARGDDLDDVGRSEHDRAIDAGIARALEVLDELTMLTQQPASRLRLTDLNDVICSAVEAIRQAEAPSSSVSLRLQGDLPKLLLDADRIRLVLMTLLEHGLSGTEDRQATVASRLQNSEVLVEVRVPRRKVPAGVLESLFLPFLPQDPNAPKGNLSLADQIVNEHGGQLRARSDAREGLFFGLSFPVVGNQERRARRRDRRGGRERRRVGEGA